MSQNIILADLNVYRFLYGSVYKACSFIVDKYPLNAIIAAITKYEANKNIEHLKFYIRVKF